MRLARFAMRIAAARALKGVILAGDRVFDSAIDPIDQTIAETRQPILVVMTDDHEADITGRDLTYGDARCDLVIEAAIAARVEIPATDGDGNATTIAIPHTDEGMELVLDMIEHQVIAALTRERTDWSRVWMKLVPRISKRVSRRGASVENGVRFAARQIVITCDLIEPPVADAPIQTGTAWDDVLTVMSADDVLVPVASWAFHPVVETRAKQPWRSPLMEPPEPVEGPSHKERITRAHGKAGAVRAFAPNATIAPPLIRRFAPPSRRSRGEGSGGP